MAKRESNYKASAAEFGKRLTALYKLKIFPRLGRELAEKLFVSGVEAGANISALSSISDAGNKVRVATDAIVKLNETAFAAEVMVEGKFYTADQVAPLTVYVDKLIEALGKLVSSVKVRQTEVEKPRRPRTQRVVVEQKPVVKRKVIVRTADEILKEAQMEQANSPVPVPEIENTVSAGSADPDGFNAPYNK